MADKIIESMEGTIVSSPRRRAGLGLAGAVAAGALAIGMIGAFGAPAQLSSAAIANAEEITARVGDLDLAEQVAEKCLPSIGSVYALVEEDGMSGIAQGSCEVIDAEGILMTNFHVIDGATKIQVTVDGATLDAEVVGSDPTSDIAILRVDPGDVELVPIEIGSSADLKAGQWVMTIGSPKGESQSVSQGVISGLNRTTAIQINDEVEAYYVGLIQSDAMINSGSSGGAMVNSKGELIGVTTINATLDGDFAGMSYAIPIDYAMNIANQILENGTVEHPLFGANVLSIANAYYNGYYDPDEEATLTGAFVYEVVEGLGAQQAGIQAGDVVVKVGDADVYSPEDLVIAVRSHEIGETVTVTVEREGEQLEFDVVLGSDQDDAVAAHNARGNDEEGSAPHGLFEFIGGGSGDDGSEGDPRDDYGDYGNYEYYGFPGYGYGYGYGYPGYGYGYPGYGYPGYGYGYPGYGDYGYYGYYGYPGYPDYGYGYPGYGYGYPDYGDYGYYGYQDGQGGSGQDDSWDFWSRLGDALGIGF